MGLGVGLAVGLIVASCAGPSVPNVPAIAAGSPRASSAGPSAAPNQGQATPTGTPIPSPGARALPAHLFAPYVEMWVGDHVQDLATASGARDFTLAFLETSGPASCELVWNGTTKLDDPTAGQVVADAQALRALGGDVIPSFGGYSADHEAREIADSCADPSAIAHAYEDVIARLGVSRLDMDVEVESLDRPEGIDRRNKAIKILQDRLAAEGRTVQIQYTLPTGPDGLDDSGLAVLRDAVRNGTRVDVVNIMVFDYYDGTTTDMGAAAIQAGSGLHVQLARLYPERTDAQLWSMVGITLMPGIDDDPQATEVTTLAHAEAVLAFAQQHGIANLSMWAIERDKGACPGSGGSDRCSGIAQEDWAFTRILAPFTGP